MIQDTRKIKKGTRSFAFYSEIAEEKTQGATTLTFRDAASGIQVRANYVGQSINGFPGFRNGNSVVRPNQHRSYKLLGEIGPGKLELVERPPPDISPIIPPPKRII